MQPCTTADCAARLLTWLREKGAASATRPDMPAQGLLFAVCGYEENAPVLRTSQELEGAFEHLEYAVFRRTRNQLTRAERARLDNTIDNTLFKIDRYAERAGDSFRPSDAARLEQIRSMIREGQERILQLRLQARRAEARLAQLDSLSPEEFEEFVAELFEALGFDVERVGGAGDEGADLLLTRGPLSGVVQCKFHTRGVIGSPELQRFLGAIHHRASHKGFFVTTRTFTLAAERFAADHPIELVDGPRLVELVHEALGGIRAARPREASWLNFAAPHQSASAATPTDQELSFPPN